jgi:hypothetical protein
MCPSSLRARELLLEPLIPIRVKSLIGVPEGFDAFLAKAAHQSRYRKRGKLLKQRSDGSVWGMDRRLRGHG